MHLKYLSVCLSEGHIQGRVRVGLQMNTCQAPMQDGKKAEGTKSKDDSRHMHTRMHTSGMKDERQEKTSTSCTRIVPWVTRISPS
mmetsp:Transcript_41737/g.82415  ORF Transcript_41737/g.82415 Transcript_41737/m.82415 type:complete len:85 (-) Transcript_41737:12-266(-)